MDSAWKPPENYYWFLDKPKFKYCPCCGKPIEVENNGTTIRK